MATRCRKGFTLVELLVVIVIISMLAGMTLPAIMNARARARQNTCLNNSSQLGKAMVGYYTAKKELPGWRNKLQIGRANYVNVSWAVLLLPYMDQNTLWTQSWRNPNIAIADKSIPELGLLKCPDNHSSTEGPLSYAANCGWWGKHSGSVSGVYQVPAHQGLFVDKGSNLAGDRTAPRKSVLLEQIADGQSNTAILVENLQAKVWASRDASYLGLDVNQDSKLNNPDSETDQRPSGVGICWVLEPGKCGNSDNKPVVYPNNCFTEAEDLQAAGTATGASYARGSSKHAGGMHVTFADGSVKFVTDTAVRSIYLKMLTPNDTALSQLTDADVGW